MNWKPTVSSVMLLSKRSKCRGLMLIFYFNVNKERWTQSSCVAYKWEVGELMEQVFSLQVHIFCINMHTGTCSSRRRSTNAFLQHSMDSTWNDVRSLNAHWLDWSHKMTSKLNHRRSWKDTSFFSYKRESIVLWLIVIFTSFIQLVTHSAFQWSRRGDGAVSMSTATSAVNNAQ